MALSQAVLDAFNKGNGGGRSAALPDNTRVRAVIQPSTKSIGYIERQPFSTKAESPNSRLNALRMRFVVPEGDQHANRNFFSNVPELFEQWSDKAQGLVPSYQSIGLVQALGYSVEDIDENTLKNLTDRELLNKAVELVLGVEDDPKFNPADADHAEAAAKNPLAAKRNTIKFINQARASSGQPASSGSTSRMHAAPPAAVAPGAPANDPWAAAPPAGPNASTAAPVATSADPWAAAATADPWATAAGGAPTPL
ncbi:hypothetical protein [Frigoribacterium sp. CG_9.8]|uniref:hypothetical protein n=1 Tax=Frigoribacterium sp. CG_9.8 TaxID=2787733 RepID=UPI0018CB9E4E|nr:hypothetical protein [Frigoribacterium sp. CG_9.8]MBG6106618.1 hypothetical protein [Frigoribacterium sp. CG_9.8]